MAASKIHFKRYFFKNSLSTLYQRSPHHAGAAYHRIAELEAVIRLTGNTIEHLERGDLSGSRRGAARREDAMFWVIKVEEMKRLNRGDVGARFRTDET
jgi:hypothetical protein